MNGHRVLVCNVESLKKSNFTDYSGKVYNLEKCSLDELKNELHNCGDEWVMLDYEHKYNVLLKAGEKFDPSKIKNYYNNFCDSEFCGLWSKTIISLK